MLTLQRYAELNYRVIYQPARLRADRYIRLRDRSSARAPHSTPRPRHWLRAIGHALLIGRDVLLVIWVILVLSFWIAITAGLVL